MSDQPLNSPSTPGPSTPGAAKLLIRRFTLGPYETNCYVVRAEGGPGGGACWIVDASFGPEPIIDFVKAEKLHPEAIVLTHAHVDHIAGVARVKAAFPAAPVLIHADESAWLNNPEINLSALSGTQVTAPGPDRELADGEELTLGATRWRVLHTPGHSPGGIGLYCEGGGVLIAGDALFAGSVGRTDLPGGDFDTLARSIRQRFYTLPGETRVLPGHGPPTTIGQEKLANPFVRG